MVDLTTSYLGLELKTPLIASSSPLTESIDNIRRMADSGAGAVVLPSMFEEQIQLEHESLMHYFSYGSENYDEAVNKTPNADLFYFRVDDYLAHIERCRKHLEIPVIGSINGVSLGGWVGFARKMEEAGAQAVELNIYRIPTALEQSGLEIETLVVEIVRAVKEAVSIPVAVKLSPYYSNMANVAQQVVEAGADGLVLFNRFYQPDINLKKLKVEPNVYLSSPHELRLPLRWIAILSGRIEADLAATSGIHSADGVLKVLLAGATVAMMTSALIRHGVDYFQKVEADLREWMRDNDFHAVEDLRGMLSQRSSEDPEAFERAQYLRSLRTFLRD